MWTKLLSVTELYINPLKRERDNIIINTLYYSITFLLQTKGINSALAHHFSSHFINGKFRHEGTMWFNWRHKKNKYQGRHKNPGNWFSVLHPLFLAPTLPQSKDTTENKCHQQHYLKKEMQIITMKNNSEPSVPRSQPQKEVRLSGKKYLSTMAIISSQIPHAWWENHDSFAASRGILQCSWRKSRKPVLQSFTMQVSLEFPLSSAVWDCN